MHGTLPPPIYNFLGCCNKSPLEKTVLDCGASGLCYANFLSEDCDTYGGGVEIAEGEFLQADEDGDILFCHYKASKPERSMAGFEILYRETHTVERFASASIRRWSYFDCILQRTKT